VNVVKKYCLIDFKCFASGELKLPNGKQMRDEHTDRHRDG